MKTTVELPKTLLRRAKIVAAQRRTTLKNLLIQGLEQVVQPAASPGAKTLSSEEEEFLELDRSGVPVLKSQNGNQQPVTNQAIDDLREELGV
jgi:hypothetical protein